MEKLGFARDTDNRDTRNYSEAKDKIMSSLKDYFRPEFLNRLDDTIIFDILGPEAIKNIVKIQVEHVVTRLAEKHITLNMSLAVYDYLAKEGYNPQYGARPLKRLIQTKILTPVANLLISQVVSKGGTIEVGVKSKEGVGVRVKGGVATTHVGPDSVNTTEFTFEVKNKNVSARNKGESPIVMPSVVGQK
jgi:ATP-dependent Clp protease ATP-binding subunit ClpC